MLIKLKEALSKEFLDNFNRYKINSSKYSFNKENFELLNNIGIIKNFEDFLKGKEIIFFEHKIKVLRKILLDYDNIKYITGLQLFNGIIDSFILLKDQLTFEVLIDELKLNKNDFIFDNEILIYSLCIEGADTRNIAKLLNLLLKYLSILNKDNEFINKINISDNFRYSQGNGNLITAYKKATKNYSNNDKVLYEGERIGDIFYLDNFYKKSGIIEYKFNTKQLIYKGNKIISFNSAKLQSEFIEKLYKNLNSWISEDELNGNSEQTLKDIKKKMKNQDVNQFTELELKMIFQSFKENNKSYFIMIG